MNTTIFVIILAVALFEIASLSESARHSSNGARNYPSEELVDEQIVEIEERPSPRKLQSSGSSSFNGRNYGRTFSKSSRTPSKPRPRRTRSSPSSNPSTSNITTPVLNAGQYVVIDNNGTVTLDDKTVLYKEEPKLKGDPKEMIMKDGHMSINGLPILTKSPETNANSFIKVNSSFKRQTMLKSGAKWTKLEILPRGQLRITDDLGTSLTTLFL